MRILICGIDGYIGWPLALHLLRKGHEVCGIDNYFRRDTVEELGSESATPIAEVYKRREVLKRYSFIDEIALITMKDKLNLHSYLNEMKPEVIVHLAEQPSAPWSMASKSNAINTQIENIAGTLNLLWSMKEICPNAHLIKLGSMGEYGTPNCDIPEGMIPSSGLCDISEWVDQNPGISPSCKCPMSNLPFPRSPGSFYHLSKVHDTYNIIFACKNWNLRSTDIMQGVVFGLTDTHYETVTRFDYDESFGTAINRFIVQAITDVPLTVYGSGNQKRGFIPLCDSIQCITIAIENPPKKGEYRTFNQFENVYSLNDLAVSVSTVSEKVLGNHPIIKHIKNPRKEMGAHYYNPINNNLKKLGYKTLTDMDTEIAIALKAINPWKYKINKNIIYPRIRW